MGRISKGRTASRRRDRGRTYITGTGRTARGRTCWGRTSKVRTDRGRTTRGVGHPTTVVPLVRKARRNR